MTMYSYELERFIKVLKQSQLDYQYHFENVGKKDKETQDLLHQIELGKSSDRDKAATKLARVRKERRVSKDIVENIEPIIKYLDENKRLLSTYSQLLGQIRKAEKSHQGRVYKAKIRDDLTI